MNLPPLPLIDGALLVDNTFIERLTTCPRALLYSQLYKRISSADKPSLNFGSAIHTALEYRYRVYKNTTPDMQLEMELADVLTKFFDENPQPMDDWRSLNWAVETMRRYNEKYKVENFQLLQYDEPRECDKCAHGFPGEVFEDASMQATIPCPWCSGTGKQEVMVELPFALPLFTYETWNASLDFDAPEMVAIPVIYTGKIDLPVQQGDNLIIIDHKTTSMLGPSFWDTFRKSAQQLGYCWAFSELTGKKVSYYTVNAIRTKEPPQYVTGESNRKGAQTAESWWNESLARETFTCTEEKLVEWKTNVIALVKEFFYHYQQGFFPQKTVWCCGKYGKCQYFDVCDLPAADRDFFLESGQFADNVWSPLRQPKTIS